MNECVARGRSRASIHSGTHEEEEEHESCFESFKEWILPTGTFARSETPKTDLLFARGLSCVFWLAITGFIIYTVFRLVSSGRVELFRSSYKYDVIETPSLAFCPFNPNQTVQWPAGAEPWAFADKIDTGGVYDLDITPRNCSFDRNCACVDMYKYRFQDVTPDKVDGKMQGVQRQTIEMRTNFSDPSPERVLKVGIYDNFDKSPDWIYVNQGSLFIAQLELTVWTVIDVSMHGLFETLKGDMRAMLRNKHIYRYTSQQVGDLRLHQPWRETSIRYEMKTFFVEETMSSRRAWSLYTLAVIILLFVLRAFMVDAFMATFFPEWQEKKAEETVVRELSDFSLVLRSFVSCILPAEEDSGSSERKPLMADHKASP